MATITSNARAFLDHIKKQSDPHAFLSAIPSQAEPFFEEEWLDFKGAPRDDNDTKRIWSKALSGFSNIGDGLIIWGIDARPAPPRGIDAACGLRLIDDPSSFESRLRDLHRNATNPPVLGVELKSFPNPADSSAPGFVVCLIPESKHKPHRAEYAGENYYFRALDDFLITPPSLLRVLFYPNAKPVLALNTNVKNVVFADVRGGFVQLECTLTLVNFGSASARDSLIVGTYELSGNPEFPTGSNWEIDQGSDWQDLSALSAPSLSFQRGPTRSEFPLAFEARRTIHPHYPSKVATLKFPKVRARYNQIDSTFGSLDGFKINLFVYADGLEPYRFEINYGHEDLVMKMGEVCSKDWTHIPAD